jgi:hypothetical protein
VPEGIWLTATAFYFSSLTKNITQGYIPTSRKPDLPDAAKKK